MRGKTIALIGNPNSGKTTLFNGLTGGKIKTGNWPGVTVEKRYGKMKSVQSEINIVDLPGIYSFSAHSEDQRIARDYALSGEHSLIVNIVDATNLERNLYLTTQLIEMKVPLVLVINMCDLAEKHNIVLDIKRIAKSLSIPVIGISAVDDTDIEEVRQFIESYIDSPSIPDIEVEYPNEVESAISEIQTKVRKTSLEMSVDSRWIGIKLLEDDECVKKAVIDNNELTQDDISEKQEYVKSILDEEADIICADYRYGFIHGIVKMTVEKHSDKQTLTDKADRIILNKILGIPIFLFIMFIVFWATINVGGAFIDFFDILTGAIFVDGFTALLMNLRAPDWVITFFAHGVGAGIQTVSTFIPIIFIMFMMFSILEDSGYMARAAFVMDRLMNKLGLSGKAFVPMLLGFGCTVPAVMATRTIESKRDRFLTIFITPFMSCGAKLPVYALFAAAFFPAKASLIVYLIYLIGIVFAVLTGYLLKKTLFRGEESYFIMELPPYHKPRPKHILIHTWYKMKGFVFRAGKVIILAVIVLSFLNTIGTDGTIGNEDTDKSVLAAVGKTITPVFNPMGIEQDNWPATVGLFTGLFAKEAVVGTLNSLYTQMGQSELEDKGKDKFNFMDSVNSAFMSIGEGISGIWNSIIDPLGLSVMSNATNEDAMADEVRADSAVFKTLRRRFSYDGNGAFAYLLFILLYFPCVATFGTIVKETGILFGTINAIYLTVTAWNVSTLYYQLTSGFNILWIIVSMGLLGLTILTFIILNKSRLIDAK